MISHNDFPYKHLQISQVPMVLKNGVLGKWCLQHKTVVFEASCLQDSKSKVSGLDVFWDRSRRKGSCSQPQWVRALGTALWMPKEGICSSQVMGSCISHDHSFLICPHKWLNQTSLLEKFHSWPKAPNNEKSGSLMRLYSSATTLTVRGLFLLSFFSTLQSKEPLYLDTALCRHFLTPIKLSLSCLFDQLNR